MQVDGCWEKWGGCGRGGTNKAARFSQIKLWVRGCDATLSLAVAVMHPFHDNSPTRYCSLRNFSELTTSGSHFSVPVSSVLTSAVRFSGN